jgi:phage terminase large subunit GpA-like protein
MQIEKVFIDSGFRPDKPELGNEHKVYEFCRRYHWLCWPTKGRDVMTPPYRVSKIEAKPDGKRALYSVNLVLLSTDFFKSLVVSRIRTPMDVPGAFFVHSEVTEDYCKQLTSEARMVVEGRPKWVKRSRHNHFLDCEAMCAAIGYTLNVQRIPEGVERSEEAGPSSGSSDSSAKGDQPPPSEPTSSRASGGGVLRKRFSNAGSRLNR